MLFLLFFPGSRGRCQYLQLLVTLLSDYLVLPHLHKVYYFQFSSLTPILFVTIKCLFCSGVTSCCSFLLLPLAPTHLRVPCSFLLNNGLAPTSIQDSHCFDFKFEFNVQLFTLHPETCLSGNQMSIYSTLCRALQYQPLSLQTTGIDAIRPSPERGSMSTRGTTYLN